LEAVETALPAEKAEVSVYAVSPLLLRMPVTIPMREETWHRSQFELVSMPYQSCSDLDSTAWFSKD
jgi:hypothetical protein